MGNVHWNSFDDEIALWWEQTEGRKNGKFHYQIEVNGTWTGETKKSHYCMKNLQADTQYDVKIQAMQGTEVCQTVRLYCKTKRKRTRLDVTQAPYYAVGDGRTMNTGALQKALDDCTNEQTVYVPKGVYLTGALRMHSDMELYLEEGAVLRGTEVPDDYLPRIWSRFEGREMETLSGLLNLGELDHKAGATSENVVIRGRVR